MSRRSARRYEIYCGLQDYSIEINNILQIFNITGYKLTDLEIIQFLNLQISLDFTLVKHYIKTENFEKLCKHKELLETENEPLLEIKNKQKKK